MPFTSFQQSTIQQLSISAPRPINAAVLRLDLVHPVVSGNKWFKLKEYLNEALALNKKAVVTFGGAYSNHIIATAAATQMVGLQSVGIIRGEQPSQLSATLANAMHYGMQLLFVPRLAYKQKQIPQQVFERFAKNEWYLVNEGGYGVAGMAGAAHILKLTDTSAYTHIMAAVGTGTTVAGLAYATLPHQHVIGISVLKNDLELQSQIEQLLPAEKISRFTLLHNFHFGGYAKGTPQLFQFMNQWFQQHSVPSDFVYTAKLFYAFEQLVQKNYFPPHSKVLLIHSGGLQGNASLPNNTLIF